MKCLECKEELTRKFQTKFCSYSCSSTYHNRARKIVLKCINCGGDIGPRRKFCNHKCQHDWELKKSIEMGIVSFSSAKRYMEKYTEVKCAECGCEKLWNGKPLVLHLDHIDGNRKHNHPKNLRFLCPNCHSQTETFGIKNISKDGKKRLLEGSIKGCRLGAIASARHKDAIYSLLIQK